MDIPECLECRETMNVLAGARFVCINEDCDKCGEPITLNEYESKLDDIAQARVERQFESYHSGGSGFNYEEEARQQWVRDNLKR